VRFLEAAGRFTATGRRLLLYRAGRSPRGVEAAASHTAAMAGSYATTRALVENSGVTVAESLADFEDLVSLSVLLGGRPVRGRSLAGASNAGFECVALADHLAGWSLADLAPATRTGLHELLLEGGVDSLVSVRNPLDLTPMIEDQVFARIVEVLLADPGVDLGVVGCVPLTGSLNTLPSAAAHSEDLGLEASIAGRLATLWDATTKPWVVVVDAGPAYDPLAERLSAAGIPVFRTMDRALRILTVFSKGFSRST
jgi:acyl-CoA synthetase (NDP forming)